jgi:hypothetical protein
MFSVIDVETENTGADVLADNKRIISVQIGDDASQDLYYADASDSASSLGGVPVRVRRILDEGQVIAGYNLEGFDLKMLKQFMGLDIPQASVLEIGNVNGLWEKRKASRLSTRLEDICADFGISTEYKLSMNAKADKLKSRPEIRKRAYELAPQVAARRGWGADFAMTYTLDKLAGGQAILDSYCEFVDSKGSTDSLFYRYATGDVICEAQLLRALRP